MAAITINDRRCATLSVSTPMFGAWSADVALADALPLSGDAVLKINDYTLKCHVYRSASFAGATSARIIGGYGGWRNVIPPKGYSHEGGVKKSEVITDAARACGEKVEVSNDVTLGTSYVREQAKAENVLKILAKDMWWIDSNGVTQVRDRPSSPIASPFQCQNRAGTKGRFEISTEAIQDWIPGRTFVAPTIPDQQIVSLVSLNADNSGALRLVVLSSGTERERMLADIRNIIRSELASLTYAGISSYTVIDSTPNKITGTPNNPRMPPIIDCPMMPGLMGEEVVAAPGSTALVAFIDSDPAQPICISIDTNPLMAHIVATVLRLNSGVRPLAAFGDMAGPFPILATVIDVLG